MKSFGEFGPMKRCLCCGICCLAAFILFKLAATRQAAMTFDNNVEMQENPLSVQPQPDTKYEASGNEKKIVSFSMNHILQAVKNERMLIELVDCDIRGFVENSLDAVLTRDHESFKTDDGFAFVARAKFRRRVVFFCLNFTGQRRQEKNNVHSLWQSSMRTKSNLFRRFDALDLLVVIAPQPIAAIEISRRLQIYPNDFKEIILTNAQAETSSDLIMSCTRNIFTKIPFGYRMRFIIHRVRPKMSECLYEWTSTHERKPCPSRRPKHQYIRNSLSVGGIFTQGHFWSDSSPCFNISLRFGHVENLMMNSPKLPVFIDNAVNAYSFDKHVPVVEIRGHVANEFVLSIMLLLGVSVWFLSRTTFTETFLDIVCTVSSSAHHSTRLKEAATFAAFSWILGNVFFALILVEDMTSTISSPGGPRISRLSECANALYKTGFGLTYRGIQSSTLWKSIAASRKLEKNLIICASKFEIQGHEGFFNIRNFYGIPLDNYGRRFNIYPPLICPWPAFGKNCSIAYGFADNFESNEYAMILLRYDLLRDPLRRWSRSLVEVSMAKIDSQHNCCRTTTKMSKKLASILTGLGKIPSSSFTPSFEFPSILFVVGFSSALLHLLLGVCRSLFNRSRNFLKFRR